MEIIRQLELGPMANYTYIVGDHTARQAAVIDPGWEAASIIEEAQGLRLSITHILITHTHFDHVTAVSGLAKKTLAKIYAHRLEAGGEAIPTEDGTIIKIGNMAIKCLHTPGHSRGSQCFLVGDALFTGDTLFVDGIGRTDLPDSDPEEMFKSLARLRELPDKTIVYPGHNYGVESVTTIGEQKNRNPYMKAKSVGEFLRY